MKNKKNITFILTILCCSAMPQAYAALASNAVLDYDDGYMFCVLGSDITSNTGCAYDLTDVSGSYFGMDISGDGIISAAEKVGITSTGAGLTIGSAQAIGEFDNTWMFGGAPGNHYTQQGLVLDSASGKTASLDMTGWIINWNGNDINLYKQKYSAAITCVIDCSFGDGFSLEYTEIIGIYDSTIYELHLEGVIDLPVPVPAAVWLFASGLAGLMGFAKRTKLYV